MSTHLIVLHRCRRGSNADAFLRHWEHVHAPQLAALPQVRRYVRNVVHAAPHDWYGADEIWVDDASAADAVLAHPAWSAVAEDTVFLRTADHVVVEGAPIRQHERLPKRMTFLRRKPGLTRNQLLRYWREVHGPLAAASPGVRRYVQSASEDDRGASLFEGVAQIWLHDDAALRELVASPHFRERVKPDEHNFVATELTLTLAVREDRVVW